MNRRTTIMLAGVVIATSPALAAEVTPERLINADREPQNWLMNHRTYDAQHYSPLDKINKGNVKDIKLAYAVGIGGTSANENLEATPLAEDGFLYIVDQWGVLYKIDALSGRAQTGVPYRAPVRVLTGRTIAKRRRGKGADLPTPIRDEACKFGAEQIAIEELRGATKPLRRGEQSRMCQ
jgi:hypothetical protein